MPTAGLSSKCSLTEIGASAFPQTHEMCEAMLQRPSTPELKLLLAREAVNCLWRFYDLSPQALRILEDVKANRPPGFERGWAAAQIYRFRGTEVDLNLALETVIRKVSARHKPKVRHDGK